MKKTIETIMQAKTATATATATARISEKTAFNVSEMIQTFHHVYDELNCRIFDNCLAENVLFTFSSGIEKNTCVKKNVWHDKRDENSHAWEIAIRGDSFTHEPFEFYTYVIQSLIDIYADEFGIKVSASGGYRKNNKYVSVCKELGFTCKLKDGEIETFSMGEKEGEVFEIMSELYPYMNIYRDTEDAKKAEKKKAEKAKKADKEEQGEQADKDNVNHMVKMHCPKCNALAYLPIKLAIKCVACECEFVEV